MAMLAQSDHFTLSNHGDAEFFGSRGHFAASNGNYDSLRSNGDLQQLRSNGDLDQMKSNGDVLLRSEEEDMVWLEIRNDAEEMSREESEDLLGLDASELLLGMLESSVLKWRSLEEALAGHLASKLSSDAVPSQRWRSVLFKCFTEGISTSGSSIRQLIRGDLTAIKERDPACPSSGHAFLYFKGFHGVQVYRAANWLWSKGKKSLASALQSRASEVFGMDIHPAAHLGSGIMIDHATGVVIGETARVGNGCTLLHGVTLGGNGKEHGDRHPKLGFNVLVGAGASILGNVKIGDGAKIGASAVVLSDIPAFATAVGCPAKIIGRAKEANPAAGLDHSCERVEMFTRRMKSLCPYRHLYPSRPGCVGPHEFSQRLQIASGGNVPTQGEAMALFFELDTDHDGELLEADVEKFLRLLKDSPAPKEWCPSSPRHVKDETMKQNTAGGGAAKAS